MCFQIACECAYICDVGKCMKVECTYVYIYGHVCNCAVAYKIVNNPKWNRKKATRNLGKIKVLCIHKVCNPWVHNWFMELKFCYIRLEWNKVSKFYIKGIYNGENCLCSLSLLGKQLTFKTTLNPSNRSIVKANGNTKYNGA